MTFNVGHGYTEALFRGFRLGFINHSQYSQLAACENLDDFKLSLTDTDYKSAVQNISPNEDVDRYSEEIFEVCRQKTVDEFDFAHRQATGAFSTFMDYITYEYLIKSIQKIINGIPTILKGTKPAVLLAQCHPLGRSPQLALTTLGSEEEDPLLDLYKTVLVETPVAPYFETYFNSEIKQQNVQDRNDPKELRNIMDDAAIEIVTTSITKLWLEDFYNYTQELGGETAAIMKELLEFESDFRALNITIGSFRTELGSQSNRDSQRQDLYCGFGKLYPNATFGSFKNVGNENELIRALAPYPQYRELYKESQDGNKDFPDLMYQRQVQLCVKAFEGQSHFAMCYAYIKLKEQEERNLSWMMSCIKKNLDSKFRTGKVINTWDGKFIESSR